MPRSNLLGEEGAGFAVAQERLATGRIHHCMRWIGICERSLDILCTRAAQRDLAPGDKLGTRQTVQNWIAESRAEINAARLMVLQAAWKIDNQGSKAARDEISVVKFYVADVLMKVIERSILPGLQRQHRSTSAPCVSASPASRANYDQSGIAAGQ